MLGLVSGTADAAAKAEACAAIGTIAAGSPAAARSLHAAGALQTLAQLLFPSGGACGQALPSFLAHADLFLSKLTLFAPELPWCG